MKNKERVVCLSWGKGRRPTRKGEKGKDACFMRLMTSQPISKGKGNSMLREGKSIKGGVRKIREEKRRAASTARGKNAGNNPKKRRLY